MQKQWKKRQVIYRNPKTHPHQVEDAEYHSQKVKPTLRRAISHSAASFLKLEFPKVPAVLGSLVSHNSHHGQGNNRDTSEHP